MTISEVMKELRSRVKPENCARDPKVMRRVSRKYWAKYRAEKKAELQKKETVQASDVAPVVE